MIVRYAAGERGARAAARAGAAVVVVDTFRASTTIAVLVAKGARVVPVASIAEAAVAEADLRVGERGGAKVAGFDFGNSPAELEAARLPPGATVVLSTTNGTRVIEAAHGSSSIFTGAFVNAGALAAELSGATHGAEIFVVGCGWRGRRASEDESASGAILHRLAQKGARLDERAGRVVGSYLHRDERSLRSNSAARRLLRLGYARDLDFCLALDTVPVVPRLLDGAFVGGRNQGASMCEKSVRGSAQNVRFCS
jgi:2-phosphosulfolactate phosphatase